MSFLILAQELFDSSAFPVTATSLTDRPLVQLDFHRHEYFEILFIANGTLLNRLADEAMTLGPGDLLVTKPYVQHLLEDWSGGDGARAYSCSFLPQAIDTGLPSIEDVETSRSPNRYFFEPFLSLADEDVSAVRMSLPNDVSTRVEADFLQLIRSEGDRSPASAAHARCDFMKLLLTLSDWHRTSKSESVSKPTAIKIAASRHRPGLRKALAFIHRNFAEIITLEEAAEMSGVSVSYFSLLIKQYTGLSFLNYLTSLRMDHACSLLRGSSESITDICFKVGFNDYSNFSKRFRKVTGMTPREFRKRCKAEQTST